MKVSNAKNKAQLAIDEYLSNRAEQKTCDNKVFDGDMVNIIVGGKTGVGKSSLINEVFGEDFAEIGIGSPVTQNLESYTKDGIPLCIYDVQGLELDVKVQKKVLLELKKLIRSGLKSEEACDDIHMMWYCLASAGGRLDKDEITFINEIAKMIDVIVVLTKSYSDSETRDLMAHVLEKKNSGELNIQGMVPVNSKDYPLDEAQTKKAFGLYELCQLTYELLPAAQQRAFAAAQKIAQSVRRKASLSAIALGSAKAAAACVIPLAGLPQLTPVQEGMFRKIAEVYSVEFAEDDFTSLVDRLASSISVGSAATLSLNLLSKRSPIPQSVPAIVLSSAVAMALTVALGTAFMLALEKGAAEIKIDGTISEEFVTFMEENFEKVFNQEMDERSECLEFGGRQEA